MNAIPQQTSLEKRMTQLPLPSSHWALAFLPNQSLLRFTPRESLYVLQSSRIFASPGLQRLKEKFALLAQA